MYMKTTYMTSGAFGAKSLMMKMMLVVGMMIVGLGVRGADETVIWTATSGALGSSAPGSGTISTGSFTWNYTRTLKSGVTYTGWSSNCIQLGKNGGVENITFSTNNIPGTIKSVSVECASYQGKHNVSITVGGSTYLASTATSSWTTVGTKTGTGTSSGEIVISFTGGTRALYIKSITVVYAVAPSYTITAQSNNNSLGTVSLSGTTITATPNDCVEYASPAYSITSGRASVTQSGNSFTVTPSSDCTVRINFAERETYNVTWNVNGSITSESYCEGTIIPVGDVPVPTSSNCDGSKVFVGWTTHSDYYNFSTAPDDLSTNLSVAVTSDVTYYAVFAVRDIAGYEESLIQTLQYDTWSYSGSTTDKSTYRMFHTGSYIQSDEFDLSKLSKVIVYGGTFGGAQYNSLTIGDGTNTWKDVTVTGNSQTGENIYTDGTTLSGTGRLRITSNSGTDSDHGVRISKVMIYAMAPVYAYTNYTTDCSHSDKFSVIYDANGAEGDVPEDDNEYDLGDNATVLVPENLSMEGFFFDRWNTAADGSGTNYRIGDEIEVNANVRLYAMWGATILWLANGLVLADYNYSPNEYIEDNGPQDAEAEEYACTGKHFVGWAESQFEEQNDRPAMMTREQIANLRVTGGKIYYAVYADVNPNDAPLNTILWSETWDGGTSGTTPSGYAQEGTSVYNDESLSYSQSGSPYIRDGVDDHYAGGTVPELLVPNAGAWIISNIPTGGAYQMLFTFKSNHANFNLTTSTDNVTISGSEKRWTVTISGNVTNFNLTLTNTSSNNVRIDDVELKIIQISATADNYTTFCPCAYEIDGISDNALVWAGKNANADWNSTINWTRYYGGGYHLATDVPTSSSQVYIIEEGRCGITALPHITRDESCSNLTMVNGLNLEIAENHTLTINGAATFTSGIISGNVVFGNSASATGAKPTSHVDGKVTKNGSAEGFSFPTGSNGNLGKVEVTDGTATNVSVQYFSNPAGFGTNDLPRWWNAADMSGENPFNHVSNVEYWKISSTEAITADFVAEASTDMHFNSETAEEDRIPTNIQMAFYDNNRWTNVGGTAYISDNTLSITGVTIPASATRGISGNYTTFGSKSKSTILPIELVSFTAECNGNRVVLEWTTATERNNSYFVVERSDDAVYFTEIARLAGAGNSIEPLSYTYTDYNAHGGDNYYRLVQVDYDGTRTASEIVSATCHAVDGEPEVLVYPNPFLGDLMLNLENFDGRNATVEIFDMFGRMLAQKNISSTGNSYQMLLNLNDLPAATYNVRVNTADFVINRKVVKN